MLRTGGAANRTSVLISVVFSTARKPGMKSWSGVPSRVTKLMPWKFRLPSSFITRVSSSFTDFSPSTRPRMGP
ncbi:hypothetical protein D3C71_2090190 [compost metagenome]